MKSIILVFLGGLLLIAGCSKTATSDRDAFVGNYHMLDSVLKYSSGSSGPVFDTITRSYDLTVIAIPNSSTLIQFINIGNKTSKDTAEVVGTLATFVNKSPNAATAISSGNNITLKGGEVYYNYLNGATVGHGTKFQ
jgi:hypothetical protein